MPNYILQAEYAVGPGLYGSRATANPADTQYRQWNFLQNGEWFDSYDLSGALSPSFSIIPTSTGLTYAKALGISKVTFSLNTSATGLRATRTIINPVRTYTFTGVANILKKGFYLGATVRTYAVNTTATNFKHFWVLTATKQTWNMGVQTANLFASRRLIADSRTYAVGTTNTVLKKGFYISAATRTYAVTGVANIFKRFYVLTAAQRAYAFTGLNTGLFKGFKFPAVTQGFTLSGLANDFRFWHLNTTKVTFSLTIPPADVLRGYVVNTTTRTFATNSPAGIGYFQTYRLLAEYALGKDLYGAPATGTTMEVMYRQWEYLENGEWFESYDSFAQLSPSYGVTPSSVNLAYSKALGVTKATFNLTGNNAGVFRAARLFADPRTYTVGTTNTVLKKGFYMFGAVRNYVVTPVNNIFRRTYVVTSVKATYNLNGINTPLLHATIMPAAARTYTVNTTNTVLKRALVLPATTRSYSVSSFATSLIATRYLINPVRTYTFTGIDTGLFKGFKFQADKETFLLNGIDSVGNYYHLNTTKDTFTYSTFPAIVTKGFTLIADTRNFSTNVAPIDDFRTYVLTADFTQGTTLFGAGLSVDGHDLLYRQWNYLENGEWFESYDLNDSSPTFSVMYMSSELKFSKAIAADRGIFSFSPTATRIVADRILFATTRSYSLAGNSAVLNRGFKIEGAVRAYTLTGVATALRATRTFSAARGIFSLAGTATGVYKGFKLTATLRIYALDTFEAKFNKNFHLDSVSRSYSVSGNNIILKRNYRLTSNISSYALSGITSGLYHGHKAVANTGVYSLTGNNTNFRYYHEHSTVIPFYVTPIDVKMSKGYAIYTTVGNFSVNAGGQAQSVHHYTLTADYADGVAMFGAPRTDADLNLIHYRLWNYLENGEWYDSYDFMAHRSPSYGAVFHAIDLRYGYNFQVDRWTLDVIPRNITFKATRILPIAKAEVAVSPRNSTLYKGYTLSVSTKQFALSGRDAVSSSEKKLYASPVAFDSTLNEVGNLRGYRLDCEPRTAQSDSLELMNYLETGEWFPSIKGQNRSIIFEVAPTWTQLFYGKTMIANLGQYSLTGQDAELSRIFKLAAFLDQFNVSSQAATLAYGRRTTFTKGTFTIAGSADFKVSHILFADSRTYSVTGVDAPLRRGANFSVENRSFSVTGVPVTTRRGYTVYAESSYTAVTPSLSEGRYFHFHAHGTSSFAVVPSLVRMEAGYPLPISRRTFFVTGFGTALGKGYYLKANGRVLVLDANASGPKLTKVLFASAANFPVTGSVGNLDKNNHLHTFVRSYNVGSSPITTFHSKALHAHPIEYVYNDTTITGMYADRLLVPAKATFSAAITSATILARRYMVAYKKEFIVDVPAAGYHKTYILHTSGTSFSLQGNTSVRTYERRIVSGTGAITAVGFQTGLKKNYRLSADVDVVQIDRYDAGNRRLYKLNTEVGFFANQETISALKGKYLLLTEGRNYAANSSIFGKLEKGYVLQAQVKNLSASFKPTILAYFKTLVTQARSYAVAGTQTSFKREFVLDAFSTVFVSLAKNANLAHGRVMSPIKASFSLTGENQVLARGWNMPVSSEAFAFTGVNTNGAYGRAIAADNQTYSITGQGTEWKRTYILYSDRRWFLLGAPFVFMSKTRPIYVDSGVFVATVPDIGYFKTYILHSTTGQFSVDNTFTPLLHTLPIYADTTSFRTTITNVTLRPGKRFVAECAEYLVGARESNALRQILATDSAGIGLQSEEDTWLTDPVADSIYKDVVVEEDRIDVYEGEIFEEVETEKAVDVSAAIRRALAFTSTPEVKKDADNAQATVTIEVTESNKILTAKIREYR